MNSKSMSAIKTIFFDLDNTLIPTRTGDSKACRKVSIISTFPLSFFS